MSAERRGPAVSKFFNNKGGRGEMKNAPINLQELRRRIYAKAKAEKKWRFWGIYVHVCKMETLKEAYRLAKLNNGAPGIDGVTFEEIEKQGLENFLKQLREELLNGTYKPMRYRQKDIPKEKGKRTLKIAAIRDRVVQGALKLILEPIFEADFQEGSYGYRPRRTAHQAIERVSKAAYQYKTRIWDIDLKTFFDNIRHDKLMEKIAARVNDAQIMRLVKLILKAGGNRGIAQGSPISPLWANLYLNEVDKMLEKAKEVTKAGNYIYIEYARFADDMVILIHCAPKWEWLVKAVYKRLLEELGKLGVTLNEDKTKLIDLNKGESFSFLGFDFRRMKSRKGKWYIRKTPRQKARTKLMNNLKEIFGNNISHPLKQVIDLVNPVLRGWVNYFRVGNSSKCFSYVKDWVEKKVRRHLMRARNRKGFGWNRWSKDWLYNKLGLYNDYKICYIQA